MNPTNTDGAEKVYVWTDQECEKISRTDFFPSSIMAIQKDIITKFFDFYLSGKRPKNTNVTDIAFAVLSIVPVTPKIDLLIWPPEEYKENGTLFNIPTKENVTHDDNSKKAENVQSKTSITTDIEPHSKETQSSYTPQLEPIKNEYNISNSNEQVLNNTNIQTNSKLLKQQDNQEKQPRDYTDDDLKARIDIRKLNNLPDAVIRWFQDINNTKYAKTKSFDIISEVSDNATIEYGPVENAAFIKSITNLLDKWYIETARATVKYFFGVVALVLLRATTKGYYHMKNVFCNNKFLNIISFCKGQVEFAPPHKRFIKSAYRSFKSRDRNVPIMFAKILMLYTELNDKHKFKTTLRNALLLYTADYGLNLISMWTTINKNVNINQIKQIAKASLNEDTKLSWTRLKNFYEICITVKTYRWARVVDSKYYDELSCKRNYNLAVIFALFVEKITNNPDIWKALWVSAQETDLDNLKEEALVIYYSCLG